MSSWILLGSVILIACIIGNKISSRLGVPTLFFFIALGMLFGSDGLLTVSYTHLSIEFLVMVVLGGMGSTTGSILAAIVLTILPEALRGFSDYRMLLYSIVLIVMMPVSYTHLDVYKRQTNS